MMTLYRDRILPHLIHFVMQKRDLAAYRSRVVAPAHGRVLEIGIGSGLNLPFYGTAVCEVVGLDPSAALLARARVAAGRVPARVDLLEARAERIPLNDGSIDTIVMTWTLCSVADPAGALGEMRRVLKPAGRLLFVEHGRAPDAGVRAWQNRLTPLWKRAAGGCHLNRPIPDLIHAAGFQTDSLDTAYMRGPKFATFMYEGVARPR